MFQPDSSACSQWPWRVARTVDFMIATRLRDAYLKQAAMEEGADIMVKPSGRRACWRNVKLNFKPLEVGPGGCRRRRLRLPASPCTTS